MTVRLREITKDTVISITKLDAGDEWKQVAPNSVSIGQAYFQREAWFRAIYADDQPVGFVMLYDPSLVEHPDEPDFFLWRLMIDRTQQGKGYRHAPVEALVKLVATRPGARQLLVSHVRAAERLQRFYQSLGFRSTGTEDHGELMMERAIA